MSSNEAVLPYWPVIALLVAALAVGVVILVLNWPERPEPNYSQIEDGLYLGGYAVEPPPGTQAVLNLCQPEDKYQVEVQRWEPIPDGEPAPSIDWLQQQVEFIDAQRRAGRQVFVHCQAGGSRSGLVVTAYLMARNGWTRDEALTFVRARRPVVSPNPAFMRLLLEWEAA